MRILESIYVRLFIEINQEVISIVYLPEQINITENDCAQRKKD